MLTILILAAILFVLNIVIMQEDNKITISGIITFIICLAILVIGLIQIDKQDRTPTAIDVYRDKTTLEITYRDSVAIDSLVVFKIK